MDSSTFPRRSLDSAAIEILGVDDEYFQEDATGVIISSTISNILLFFLIFGLSATVNLRDLTQQLTNKFAILSGITMQFFVMPLMGFTSILIFSRWGFSRAMGVSLLVVTASPGGSYSNWWCSLFNAELALSVAMTSVSSLLSIGLLPANLFLYGYLAYGLILVEEGEEEGINIVSSLDYGAIFITLGVVMGAILGGLFVGYHYDSNQFHKRANYFGSICGITLILFSAFLGSGGASGAETNFWSLPWSFYVGTAFPCLIGMALANLISRSFRLSFPEVVAISIECCYQNTAIGTSVAVTMFGDPTEQAEAVSVPLVYGMVEAILISLYCIWAWKAGWTKAPADEKLCVVMIKTYEIHDSNSEDDDEMVEFDPQVVENLYWWQRCFVPKYPDSCHLSGADVFDSALSPEGEQKRNKDEQVEASRARFNSEDVTVSTNLTTPPGTPDVKQAVLLSIHNACNNFRNNNSSHNRSNSNDLETPSKRAISAINEEDSEEAEKSSEDDKEHGEVIRTKLSNSL
mmetsp:Transcript_4318/g.9713  ORF Transcript_4318/g.9713 Transcript_4318/m.9713 type:complete len:518 (-) Transcript_4318:914-2467(-)|eukprot:CAMPEP_0201131090 /NCGR_PEP_ID=MMETSP0850-20130426/41769_1 /ASSEMBLY_ACC=CAM_ASM_000622 /TAXON_ID=183588 /ORGANISM="Pseudo-nitzschia fraudulenta, Strain WWA7" /LENGTH=517 /DNA_ID=CAMNT_0047401041 /DNA_START=247 /DNA_END=1800 /DNA_ORIENTATION=-